MNPMFPPSTRGCAAAMPLLRLCAQGRIVQTRCDVHLTAFVDGHRVPFVFESRKVVDVSSGTKVNIIPLLALGLVCLRPSGVYDPTPRGARLVKTGRAEPWAPEVMLTRQRRRAA